MEVITKQIIITEQIKNFGTEVTVEIDGEIKSMDVGLVEKENKVKLTMGLINTLLTQQLLNS